MPFLELVTIVVDDYDPAIEFFVGVLGFELVDDSPSLTNDGRPKRWVVVGSQVAGRVGFFLRVDDFEATYDRMVSAGVEFVTEPRAEGYGRLAVFVDIAGNRWDLLGPL